MKCKFTWTKDGMIQHCQGAYVRAEPDSLHADELLAACKSLLSLLGSHDVATAIAEQFSHPDIVNKAIDDAEAAIAEAE